MTAELKGKSASWSLSAWQSISATWQGATAGLKGNVVLYTSLMTVGHKGGQPGRAMDIFRAMEFEGLQADVVRN